MAGAENRPGQGRPEGDPHRPNPREIFTEYLQSGIDKAKRKKVKENLLKSHLSAVETYTGLTTETLADAVDALAHTLSNPALRREAQKRLNQLPDEGKFLSINQLIGHAEAHDLQTSPPEKVQSTPEVVSRFDPSNHETRRIEPTIPAPRQELQPPAAQPDTHEAREAVKDQDILDKVIEIGGIEAMINLPKGYHKETSYTGYSFDSNQKVSLDEYPQARELMGSGIISPLATTHFIENQLAQHSVHEALVSAPLMKTTYQDKDIDRRGRLGWGKETRTRSVRSGELQQTFGEAHPNADPKYAQEPAVSLRYQTAHFQGTEARRSHFGMTIVLPETIARELVTQIKDDPELMHRLVDRAVTGDGIGIDSTIWHKGIEGKTFGAVRPPYDQWKAENGGAAKIFISDERIDPTQPIEPWSIVTSDDTMRKSAHLRAQEKAQTPVAQNVTEASIGDIQPTDRTPSPRQPADNQENPLPQGSSSASIGRKETLTGKEQEKEILLQQMTTLFRLAIQIQDDETRDMYQDALFALADRAGVSEAETEVLLEKYLRNKKLPTITELEAANSLLIDKNTGAPLQGLELVQGTVSIVLEEVQNRSALEKTPPPHENFETAEGEIVDEEHPSWEDIIRNAKQSVDVNGSVYWEITVGETSMKVYQSGEKAGAIEVTSQQTKTFPRAQIAMRDDKLIILPGDTSGVVNPSAVILGQVGRDGKAVFSPDKPQLIDGKLVMPGQKVEIRKEAQDPAKPAPARGELTPEQYRTIFADVKVVPNTVEPDDIRTEFRKPKRAVLAAQNMKHTLQSYVRYRTRLNDKRGREAGHAKIFAEMKLHASHNPDLNSPDRFLLGDARGFQLALREGEHLIVLGPTGSGKTESIVIPQILAGKGNVISTAIDPEIYWKTHEYARSQGDVRLFDPFEMAGKDEPRHGWNPLMHTKTAADARQLAQDLILGSQDTQAAADRDYWNNRARDLLGPLLFFNSVHPQGSMRNVLVQMSRIMEGGEGSEVDKMADWLAWKQRVARTEKYRDNQLARDCGYVYTDLRKFLSARSKGEANAQSSVTFAENALEPFRDEAILASTLEHTIDAEKLWANDDPDNNPTLYMLAGEEQQKLLRGVFVAMLGVQRRAAVDESLRNRQEERRRIKAGETPKDTNKPTVKLILDEAANIAPIPNLPQILSVGRKQKIQILSIFQDESQIIAIYGREGMATIENNANGGIFQLWNSKDRETINQMSRGLGTVRVTEKSKSVTTTPAHTTVAKPQSKLFGPQVESAPTVTSVPRSKNKQTTTSKVDKPILSVPDISQLPPHTGWLLRGGTPYYLSLIAAKDHPGLKGRYAHNHSRPPLMKALELLPGQDQQVKPSSLPIEKPSQDALKAAHTGAIDIDAVLGPEPQVIADFDIGTEETARRRKALEARSDKDTNGPTAAK